MGYLWDIYGISKEQHKTGVKEIKKKMQNKASSSNLWIQKKTVDTTLYQQFLI